MLVYLPWLPDDDDPCTFVRFASIDASGALPVRRAREKIVARVTYDDQRHVWLWDVRALDGGGENGRALDCPDAKRKAEDALLAAGYELEQW